MPDKDFFLWLFQSPFRFFLPTLMGALFGSFANVCISRIPKNKSVVFPRSFCPKCEHPIPAYDNIPILSFLFLRGRCRFCHDKISWQYPLVEILSVVCSLLLFERFMSYEKGSLLVHGVEYLVAFFFFMTLLILSVIDAQHKILPNRITYPGMIVFFILGRVTGWVSFVNAGSSLVLGYLLIRLLADGYYFFTKREGIGYGDGKLLAMVGGLLGIQGLCSALFLGSVLGTVVGIPILLRRRRHVENLPSIRHMTLPFGPFLSAGALLSLYLFAGREVSEVLFKLAVPWFLQVD